MEQNYVVKKQGGFAHVSNWFALVAFCNKSNLVLKAGCLFALNRPLLSLEN